MLIRTILLILLFPALSAAQPLNTNGDFADATPGPVSGEDVAGWIIEVQSGSAEFEIVEEPVYASGHALKVTPAELGPDPWSLQVIADGIPVEPGQTYIYSVWARSESGGGTANFTVGNYDFHEYGRIGSSDVMLTDEWQEFTFTFTITDEETTIRAPIHFSFQSNADNPVYIDYLRILEEGAGILPPPVDIPLAEGKGKFLGNIYDQSQRMYFSSYWNQITPENGGKWGYVQPDSPDAFNWGALDAAYQLAKENNIPIRLHSLVWGNQQPRWMGELSDDPDAQLEALERWMLAVAERYPDLDMVEVVNEPLHDPPTAQADGQGGDYFEALGGAGETGWDWVLTAFRMAREIFPKPPN